MTNSEQLLQQLDNAHTMLLSALESVPPDLHNQRPAEDRWSVSEVVEHLAIVEDRICTLLKRQLSQPSETPVEGMTTITVEFLLDRNQKRVASESSQPSGALETEEALDALDRIRAETCETVRASESFPLDRVSMPHPLLGPLDFHNWIIFLAGHEMRHAAQIREIGETLGE